MHKSPGRARTVVLATANPGKVRELRALLRGLPIRLISLAQLPSPPLDSVRGDPSASSGSPNLLRFASLRSASQSRPETGLTYEDNARSKALTAARATGLPTIAEDSGIEVDALGGWPGVKSNRFLGPTATSKERNRRILELLSGVPTGARTARFRCVAALAVLDGRIEVAEGTCEGRIAESPAGSRRRSKASDSAEAASSLSRRRMATERAGFGYDPIFIPRGFRRTMAQLSAAEKNRISHRGKAVRALIRRASRLLRDAVEARPREPGAA